MRFWNGHRSILAFVILLGLVGCEEKLKDKRTAKISAGDEKGFVIPSSKSERKVVAEVSATEPVNANFAKSGEVKPLAEHKELSKSFTLECTQPANQELTFTVNAGPKTSEVTVNLSSK